MSVDPAPNSSPFVFGGHTTHAATSRCRNAPPRRRSVPTAGRVLDEVIDRSLRRKLDDLCANVINAVPSASGAGVVIADSGPWPREPEPSSKAATHAGIVATPPTAHAVLRTEWLLQEGPVRTSIDSGQAAVSGRLAADRRWPRLGRALTSDDTASAVAVPLMLGPAFPGGALAVYSRAEDAFDPRDVRVLMTLAYAMADIIARDRLWWCAQWILQQSGYARIVHQAVGILISRNCDEGQALARLQRISSATDRPLAEVAQMIVDEALTEAHLQYIVQTPQQRITHVAVGR